MKSASIKIDGLISSCRLRWDQLYQKILILQGYEFFKQEEEKLSNSGAQVKPIIPDPPSRYHLTRLSGIAFDCSALRRIIHTPQALFIGV